MSARPNQLSRTVAKLQGLPLIGQWATSFALGRVVPYVGTSGLKYEVLSSQRVVVSIRNQRKVQNHADPADPQPGQGRGGGAGGDQGSIR